MNKRKLIIPLSALALSIAANAQKADPDVLRILGADGAQLAEFKIDDVAGLTFPDPNTLKVSHKDNASSDYSLNDAATIVFGLRESHPQNPSAVVDVRPVDFSVVGGRTVGICSPDGIVAVNVFDIRGRKVAQADVDTQAVSQVRTSVSLANVAEGIYVVVVETPLAVVSQKITVK